MARPRMTWVYQPPKPAKPRVSATYKAEVQARARNLIASVLKPRHVKSPPDEQRFNYIVDLGSKWYRNYFYLFATYASPGPYALSPSFEAPFARLEYAGTDQFALAFMRYTGRWIELYQDLSLQEIWMPLNVSLISFPERTSPC